ncbi:hypothetical protein A9995_02080 [Erythrobacter sp. QSSC1-22B]|uniref:hypothetical protein n=1 Tax=Erythrobacter sp. QSSC1-22B TaxID=1860125 RepID=UPI000804BD6E|nr:hypothetical protein [Erythrobacter sp. QSSC1-22B]OBX20520.1 hypothetical protein A9995_02080 [Erythrobacter sp. QSSC1-22B]
MIDRLARPLALLLLAGALSGCDAATQIAGEAVEGEVRNVVAAQCEQVAQNMGVVAARVSEVCQCSADTFMADPDLTLEDATPANVEGIVNACAASTRETNADSTETLPAEKIGG